MSIRVMSAVWDVELPAGDKLVLLALADCANDEGRCYPGIKTLCRKTGRGERSLQGSIKALCDAGHLTRNEVAGKGCNYVVHPRNNCAPAKSAPPQKTTQTPAKSAGKPSRTVISGKAKASPQRAKPSDGFHPLPDDWQPTRPLSDNCQAKVDQWPPGALEDELESFRSWAANAAPVKGKGLKKDWDDAFGNWIRSQDQRYRRSQPGSKPASRNSAAFELAMRGLDAGATF